VSFTANFGDLTLYDGKTYNHIWVSGYSAGGANSSVYKSDDYLRLYATDGAEATWVTDNAVDLTGIRYVSIEWMNNGVTDETNNSFLVVSKSKTSNHNTYDRRLERTGQFGEEENLTKDSLNVSALDGIYYIRIHSYSAEYFSRIRVYRVYLE
jgi:hypothetical protein